MNIKTAYLTDWVKHSVFNGNLRENPVSTEHGTTLTVGSHGMLTITKPDRDGNERTWLVPAGAWHGEPAAVTQPKR